MYRNYLLLFIVRIGYKKVVDPKYIGLQKDLSIGFHYAKTLPNNTDENCFFLRKKNMFCMLII